MHFDHREARGHYQLWPALNGVSSLVWRRFLLSSETRPSVAGIRLSAAKLKRGRMAGLPPEFYALYV